MTSPRFKIFATIAFVCLLSVGAQGAGKMTKQAPAKKPGPASKYAELEARVDEYKEALRQLLPLRERAVATQAEKVAKAKELVATGLIARAEIEREEVKLADAQSKLAETQKELAGADLILSEAVEADQAVSAAAPRRGYLATSAIMRYGGSSHWNIANIASVQNYFTSHFGRAIPISAYGQTTLHDRLGFDHSNAVDVAVRPDSPEGQALIAYLRSSGIPFLAFSSAIPGKATGPHIHIGLPSHRFR